MMAYVQQKSEEATRFSHGQRWLSIGLPSLIALIVADSLMLALDGSLPRTVGAMLLLLLPGFVWVHSLELSAELITRWTIGVGLSYTLIVILGLLVYYIAGSIPIWAVLVSLNILTLGGIVSGFVTWSPERSISLPDRAVLLWLLAILFSGALFRFVRLGYSEFDGDEVKVMIPAAEVIEGRNNALFYQRNKGPGEILIPMMLWRLTGVIDERNARLLFALAGLLTIATTYLLGRNLIGEKVGLIAAGLMALNGFMVAFSRIVQYQQIVVWMSLLSVLCVWLWRQEGRWQWLGLAGVFLGVGLLAHFDAILVVPALAYLVVSRPKAGLTNYPAFVAAAVGLVVVTGLFFLPYFLTPQVTEAGDYLGRRIGLSLIKNRLDVFYHVSVFYNSLYYVMVIGLLALGYLAWAVINPQGGQRGWRYAFAAITTLGVLGFSLQPDGPELWGIDLVFLPFALVLLGAFLSPAVGVAERSVILWFASAFMSYNFLVNSPRTHFYTILPAWIILAALSATWLWRKVTTNSAGFYLSLVGGLLLAALFGGYLYHVFLEPNVELETDWPKSQLPLYWSPYTEIPGFDAYGFVHRHGWKAIGGLYASGQIKGDYETNALHSKTNWYTRNALDGCFGQTRYFYRLKHLLIDPAELATYHGIGEVDLSTGKGIDIYQMQPAASRLEPLSIEELNNIFDRTAYPAAFVRPLYATESVVVNLADVIQLTGYDVEVPRAKPGEQLAVTLYWQSQQAIPVDLHVFVHVEEAQDAANIWGQSDDSPACGNNPTSTWQPGQIVKDTHVVLINPAAPPNDYAVSVGMYLPEGNIRAPVLDETGQPIADSIRLTTLTVQ